MGDARQPRPPLPGSRHSRSTCSSSPVSRTSSISARVKLAPGTARTARPDPGARAARQAGTSGTASAIPCCPGLASAGSASLTASSPTVPLAESRSSGCRPSPVGVEIAEREQRRASRGRLPRTAGPAPPLPSRGAGGSRRRPSPTRPIGLTSHSARRAEPSRSDR